MRNRKQFIDLYVLNGKTYKVAKFHPLDKTAKPLFEVRVWSEKTGYKPLGEKYNTMPEAMLHVVLHATDRLI